jgi:Phage tail assembly chaperone protein
MWYSVHDKETLGSYGVFTEPQQVTDTQVQLEWSSDPAITGEWIKPFKDPETGDIYLKEDVELKPVVLLTRLRAKRNALLAQSDWTQMPDVSLSNKAEWAQYRQALRDFPADTTDLENPVWPCVPN